MKWLYVLSGLGFAALIVFTALFFSSASEYRDECEARGGKVLHGHGRSYCLKKEVFL